MHKPKILLIAATVLVLSAAHAHPDSAEGDCLQQANAKKRLACYDDQATRTKNVEPMGAVTKARNGSIRGSASYYFNRNIGNRPDSGTKVYLINQRIAEIPKSGLFSDLMLELGRDYLMIGNAPDKTEEVKFLKKTIADGNGNFEIKSIPIGDYTLILQSSHAKGQGTRDVLGKVRMKAVSVTAENELDASIDFGMSDY